MRNAGYNVRVLKEEFGAGAVDEEWLPAAIANGWILITKDDRWRYRQAEREILVNANTRGFVFVSKTARAIEIVETIMACMEKMAKIIESEVPPFIAHILLSRHVYVVFPRNDAANAARR
jgi:uncharacterized membrane protein